MQSLATTMQAIPGMKALRALFGAGALALAAPTAHAIPGMVQEFPASEDYTVLTWEMDDGLPSNRIFTITQTPDGYLWLGTQGGLVRFDGARFTSYSAATTPGIQTERVHAVFVTRDGTLWLGQVSGAVGRKVGDRFEAIVPPPAEPVPFELISSFAESADGAVWFAYERAPRVTRWQNGRLTTFTPADGLPDGALGTVQATHDGEIWFANSNGCAVFDGSRFRALDPESGGAVHLAPARAGGMWAARGNRLLHYARDHTRRHMTDLGGLYVHGLFEDSAETLWIETNMTGLLRYRDGEIVRVPVAGTSISAVFEDRERNLWVGRQSGGLNRVRPRQFFLRQAKDGVYEDETYSVAEDGHGRIWLSGRANMLVRATDRTNRRFEVPPGWSGQTSPRSLVADGAGGIWIGTLEGLMHWRDSQWNRISPLPNILGIALDRGGAPWMGSADHPLTRHHDGRDQPAGPPRTREIAADGAGRMWAGTDDGEVHRQNGDGWEPVPLPQGKPSGRVHCIVPDGADTVWIAVARAGFYRWRNGKAERLPPNAGFPTEDVRAVVITPEGDFWIGTGRGLYHTRRAELDAVFSGQRSTLWYRSFGRNDGLPLAEFGVGYRRAAIRTHDGHLWFASDRGALEIVPLPVEPEVPLGSVLVEDATAGGRPLAADAAGRFQVAARSGPVEIRYTLPHLTRPEEIRFRHRLSSDGTETAVWSGAERLATFARLPPGDYRFDVTAIDPAGRPLPAGAATAFFAIEASWWETTAFRLAASVAGIAALTWLVRWLVLLRVRTRMRRLEQERAIERERSRIARDMHDQLGASLTQIAITTKLLTLDPPERVAAHSRDIATIARHTVDSLDEIVWAVDPANDSLAAALDYLGQFALNFLGAAGIECEMVLPENPPTLPLPARTRHQVFLAVKEALNNIVKHAEATRVSVNFQLQQRQAVLQIQDNGRGLPAATAPRGADGMRNMHARMREIGGDCQVESAPAAGTRVVFTWPLSVLPTGATS